MQLVHSFIFPHPPKMHIYCYHVLRSYVKSESFNFVAVKLVGFMKNCFAFLPCFTHDCK